MLTLLLFSVCFLAFPCGFHLFVRTSVLRRFGLSMFLMSVEFFSVVFAQKNVFFSEVEIC